MKMSDVHLPGPAEEYEWTRRTTDLAWGAPRRNVGTIMNRLLLEQYMSWKILLNYTWLVQVHRNHTEVFKCISCRCFSVVFVKC